MSEVTQVGMHVFGESGCSVRNVKFLNQHHLDETTAKLNLNYFHLKGFEIQAIASCRQCSNSLKPVLKTLMFE